MMSLPKLKKLWKKEDSLKKALAKSANLQEAGKILKDLDLVQSDIRRVS